MALTLKQYQKNALDALTGFFQACRSVSPADAFRAALATQNRLNEANYVDVFDGAPSVCLRIPTGGGKTLLAAHAIDVAAKTLMDSDAPVALWLTPSDVIRSQTLTALNTAGHPYRMALEEHYPQRLHICDLENLQTVGRHELGRSAVVIVATIQSFRISDTTKRNVYSFFEELAPHFDGLTPAAEQRLERVSEADLAAQPFLTRADLGRVKHSIANWLALHRPAVIVDEAHNSRTQASFETLKRLQPSCVIEMTATPNKGSNVLYHVSAQELKAEQMIKLPIVLAEHPTGWKDAVRDAILRCNSLAIAAQKEPDYIRPIVLFQAQPRGGEATVDVLRAHLIEQEKLPAEQIAVATGDQKELDGINLFDPTCPIRYVITVEALKEGWDCSFAYVLCSLQEMRSAKDVEQLLGRVLRMPYARNRTQPELNQAYAHVLAASFSEAVEKLADRMVQNMGFEAFEAQSIFLPAQLPLQGGENGAQRVLIPDFVLTLTQAPVLENLPAAIRDLVETRQTTQGTTVIVRGEVSEELEEAIISAQPKKEQENVRERINLHRVQVRALTAPSTRLVAFASIPQLCLFVEGEWQVVERETLEGMGQWNLLDAKVELAGFAINETAHTFEINIENRKVVYRAEQNVAQYSLDLVPMQSSEADLVHWLNIEVRQAGVTFAEMRKYLGLVIQHLIRDRHFTLTALWRAKYQLATALLAELNRLRKQSQSKGFQLSLGGMQAVPLPEQFNHSFKFQPGFYPARPPYYSGRYQFHKHYYPVIHDLKGVGEEYDCAKIIDMLPEVKHWVRNISQQDRNSFWLPTATDYFYPDFVCELMDGRVFAIEYKGAPYETNDDSREKILVGEQWEKTSGGRCLFLMAVAKDGKGRGVAQQIADKILGKY
jgi:type III restriction enzyme